VFLEAMGCYLADCLARVGTWAATISCVLEISRRTIQGHGHVISCLWPMVLSVTTLAALLAIGGLEINLGPGVETEKIMRVLCSGATKS
jgi:hypothetical protein